ncbi:MAG: hypothetical protein ACK5KP_08065 [Paludibacteraceae bacterium]
MKKTTTRLNPSGSQLGQKAYLKSLTIFPVYYLVVWIICSVFFLKESNPEKIYLIALIAGAIWLLLTLLLETLVWSKIRHKFQLTLKEMYQRSQPWISISYYAVLISPLIIALILGK